MICKVKQTIDKNFLLTENIKSVAVGFSGGADSVCLIHILSSLKDYYGIIVKAVHINHNIRGEEAYRDEVFVRTFCDKHNIELTVYDIDVPLLAKERKISLEECGRQVRYECFEKSGCDAVAVAHTLSDSIETMLFNLARGTGTKGLAGINPKREPNIIRPLIACTREEIENYCSLNSLEYVTDSSNLSDDYTRNHIRHNIVPAFRKINSDFENSFYRAMNSIKEDYDFIDSFVRDVLKKSECSDGYFLSPLNNCGDAVEKKCLLEILKKVMDKPPEARHVEACFALAKEGKGKIQLAKDLYVSVKDDKISFCYHMKNPEEWKSSFINNVAVTPYGNFILEESSLITKDCFDSDKIKNNLCISSRVAGDTFTFKTRGVTKTLKKLFNEKKIPNEKRNTIAVLHDGKNVVWIEDIGVNAAYIPDGNSQKIISIKKDEQND